MSDLAERLTEFESSDALGNGNFSVCHEAAARIIELEEALKPFSDMAGPLFMANYHDNDLLYDPNLHYEGDVKPRLRFRDFRRARAALGAKS